MNKKLISITRSAVIAALYFILTFALQPVAFGPLQFRLSEALVLLPFIFPESFVGLGVGCLLANILSPYGIYDVIIGSAVTFAAGFLTSRIRNIFLAALPPVLLNAIFVPVLFILSGSASLYIVDFFTVLLTEGVVVYLVGIPIVGILKKRLPERETSENRRQ